MAKNETHDGRKGGLLKGKPHYDKNGKPLGGIKAIVTDTNTKVELEGGEVIINKHASRKYWRELSKINQSAGNGVPIKNPNGNSDDDPEEYKDGGRIIQFNPNHTPSKIILNYAKKIKAEYPKVWDKGGNIFGNEAFNNLKRVSDRGYWLDSEKWMYIKWRSYVARHKQDFRINGVVAMLKWVDKVNKGWDYMKKLIEAEIEKQYPKQATKKVAKMEKGGNLKNDCIGFINNSEAITKNGYYLHLKNLNNYFDAGDKTISNIKSLVLITYNSGGQSNLKVTDTINASELSYKISELLDCEISVARIIVSEQIKYAKRFSLNVVKNIENENIIIADRDEIVCTNINKEYAKGGLIAPNGKPSNLTTEQYKLVRTPEFKAWFGDWENDPENASKVVDENGEPLVVYHRSKSKKYYFNKDKQLIGWLGKGFYFSPNKDEFKEYGKTILEVFVSAKKMFSIEGESPSDVYTEIKNININNSFDESDISKTLKEIGYDGVEFKHWDRGIIISCFESNQIKLADGTNTTFDSNNPDIRFDKGGELKKGIKEELEHIETAKKLYNKQITPKESAEEIAKDHLKDNPLYYSELSKLSKKMQYGGVVDNSELPFIEQPKPIFWQMTMKQFCDYAKSTKMDTRLEGSNAKLQCEDFYKYTIIKPLLSNDAERNVFLLAIESNRMPYEAVEEIIKSAGLWETSTKKLEEIKQYNNLVNISDIWSTPKNLYLQKEYFAKNFTKSNADKWYKKHIYHYVFLDDKNIRELIAKGIVKHSQIIDRLRESLGLEILSNNDKKQLDSMVKIESKLNIVGKLNHVIDMIESEKVYTSQIKTKNNSLSPEKENFVKKVIELTKNNTKFNKVKLEKLASEYGIEEQNLVKELTELAISLMAREIAHMNDLSEKKKYDTIVELYKNQSNLSHRTSQSIMMMQYSTPAPIGYLMGLYCGISKSETKYFEPSAGNGLLTIAGDIKNATINEKDSVRANNLKYIGFNNVTSEDASKSFPEYEQKFDAVITNPPFGTIEPVFYGKYKITSLEQLMALRGLDTMKDDGKAAIIIGGHMEYDSEGRLQAGKNRIFFVYLYENYNIEDVININGAALYSRQGTSFNTRLILINGRKKQPNGYFPLNTGRTPSVDPFSKTPIDNFDDLWERVTNQIDIPKTNNFNNYTKILQTYTYNSKDEVIKKNLEIEVVAKIKGKYSLGYIDSIESFAIVYDDVLALDSGFATKSQLTNVEYLKVAIDKSINSLFNIVENSNNEIYLWYSTAFLQFIKQTDLSTNYDLYENSRKQVILQREEREKNDKIAKQQASDLATLKNKEKTQNNIVEFIENDKKINFKEFNEIIDFYNIKLPIRTKGMINELASSLNYWITLNNGTYLPKGKGQSSVNSIYEIVSKIKDNYISQNQ